MRMVDRRTGAAMLALVALPLLVKLPLLLGLVVSDPMAIFARLYAAPPTTVIGGWPTIDPNIAYTSHALGSLAARLLAAGGSLWWNPYEGVGTPLAGEMQSAALFPPTWLLLLPNGQIIEHLLFQAVAGLSTFALLRRLGAGRTGAWVGGTAFAFNGTFAWLANAVVNPICFMPLALLGVERIAAGRARSGGVLLTAAIAGSLYAGFPEVAYLNGLLIAVWAMQRVVALGRTGAPRFIGRVAIFGTAGVLLAAPLLLAFGRYLQVAHLGEHTDAGYTGEFIAPRYAVTQLLPYFTGRFFGSHPDFWADVGGYAGLALAILAAAGAAGRRERGLRLTLAGWILLCLAVTFGIWPFLELFQLIPFAGSAMLYRYLTPSWLMAAAVLAGLGVDDVARGGSWRSLQWAVVGIVSVAALLGAAALVSGVTLGGRLTVGSLIVQAAALAAIGGAVFVRRLTLHRRVQVLAAATLVEVAALFAAPLAAYPRRVDVDLSGVAFLRRELGFQRFFTLGPISGNYGSYFGIAQVNHNDLPVPTAWVRHARARLDPAMDPITLDPPSPARLLDNIGAYAAIGTRYVVVPRDRPLSRLREVHADRVTRIYEVPGTRPYLSAPNCRLRAVSRTEVESFCRGSSSLTRLELWMPGWRAEVNGRSAPVARGSDIFQTLALPAGRASVRFRFAPPGIEWGYAAALAGVMLLAAGLVLARRRRLA